MSYSLYLWHWGVLSISRWTIGIHWWSLPFQIALIFGLAFASYKYIEKPLRKGNFFGKRWKTIVVGAGVIVTLSGGIFALAKPLKGQLFVGKKIKAAQYYGTIFLKDECLENMSKGFYCYLLENNSKQTLWVLGDSHARTLALAGEEVANTIGMNLKLYTVTGTAFPPINGYQKKSKKNDILSMRKERLDDQRYIQKELYRQINVDDVIFLSMRLPYYFGGTYYEHLSSDFVYIKKDGTFGSQENYFNNWISEVVNLANIAQKTGTKVIIQTPSPEWEKELYKLCSKTNSQWFNQLQKRNCRIKSKFFIDEEIGLYKNLLEKLKQLVNSHENIYLFDTYKILCPGTTCFFTRDGVDIYSDGDHISQKWAKDFLSPEIYKFLNEIRTMEK